MKSSSETSDPMGSTIPTIEPSRERIFRPFGSHKLIAKGLVFLASTMAVFFLYDIRAIASGNGANEQETNGVVHGATPGKGSSHGSGSSGKEGEGHGEKSHSFANVFPQPKPNIALRMTPGEPELTEPSFGQVVNGSKVQLKWKEGKNAPDSYHVQIATDPNFKWLVQDEFDHHGNSFDASDLKPNTTYYWRVASFKNSNQSQFKKSAFKASSFEVK